MCHQVQTLLKAAELDHLPPSKKTKDRGEYNIFHFHTDKYMRENLSLKD